MMPLHFLPPVQHVHTSTATGTELHVARHRLTGELVVMKAMERKALSLVPAVPGSVLHAKLEHEHIARLHEVFDSQRLVIVMEHVEGINLDEFMQTQGCRPQEAQQILHQLVSAVAYMHSAGVCHRALRLSNVMLRAGTRCCIKLIDFCSCGPADKLVTRRTPVVPVYAAPELVVADAPREYSGKAVDVWALGVVMHVLLTGKYPFLSTDEMVRGELTTTLPESVPPSVADLLKGALTVDRIGRHSADDLLAHEWLRSPPTASVAAGDAVVASGSPAAWLRARAGGAPTPSGGSDAEFAKAHEAVLDELKALGINGDLVAKALEEGVRDEGTTAYHLLWQRRKRAEEDRGEGTGDTAEDAAD
jgi:serine/threonine protein kinase